MVLFNVKSVLTAVFTPAYTVPCSYESPELSFLTRFLAQMNLGNSPSSSFLGRISALTFFIHTFYQTPIEPFSISHLKTLFWWNSARSHFLVRKIIHTSITYSWIWILPVISRRTTTLWSGTERKTKEVEMARKINRFPHTRPNNSPYSKNRLWPVPQVLSGFIGLDRFMLTQLLPLPYI